MARSTTAPSTSTPAAAAHRAQPEPVGLELVGVGLCLGGVLLAGALASMAPAGATGAFRNVTGALGHAVAHALTTAVGLGAWVLPACGVAWGLGCLRGRRPGQIGRRALLLPVLMALTAVAGALLLGGVALPGLERSGPGGYLGLAMGSAIYDALGKAAGLVVVVAWVAVLRWMAGIDLVAGTQRLVRAARRRLLTGAEAGAAVLDDADAPPRRRRARRAEKPDRAAEDEAEPDADEDEEDPDDAAALDEAVVAALDGEEGDDEADEDEATPALPRKTLAVAPPAPARRRLPPRPTSRGEYVYPPLTLLTPGERTDPEDVRAEIEANATVLEETLASFGVEARVVSHLRGPVITFFEIKVPSGIRLSRVTALADDIAIALKAPSIRIVAPIPGRSTVGIEVPNLRRDLVQMRDLLEEESERVDRASIPILLGRDTAGRPIVEDLASMPHLLIAGATGSGKSVCINALLLSVLFTRGPDEVTLILVDPKQVELSFYQGIPHLLTPVVTDMRRAAKILEWAVDRMEERYAKLLACGVRNIAAFNALSDEARAQARERSHMSEEDLPDKLPQLVIVVDELADVMLTNGKEVEIAITRLAQKSRAVGIHLVLATQRPSTNVITGLIKANMPTRISFVVSSKIDSRVVLDANGADKLLGNGDMLYMHPRTLSVRRAQCTLVTDAEARGTVEFLKKHYPVMEYEDILKKPAGELGDPMKEDDLYEDAVRVVLTTKLGSASMLQRRLGIGYTRASRLIDMMCDHGVVGPHVGSKAREVYYELEAWEASLAQAAQAAPAARPAAYDRDDPPPVDTSWD